MATNILVIKKVNPSTVDVFTGTGWSGWSRFEMAVKGGRLMLRLIKGQPMKKEDFTKLYEELSK